MALWGGKDQANNSPIFGPSSVNKTPNESNRDALFENATPDAFITGETVGVYGNQVTEAGPSGWVLKRIGSGGRAGRTFSEVLVAMGSIEAVGGGGGGITPTYWLSVYGELEADNNDDYGSSVTYDNDGNVYVIGGDGTSGTISFLLKYDPEGTLLWQKNFSDLNGYKSSDSVRVDSSGNIYTLFNTALGDTKIIFVKLDSSGSIVWQKNIDVETSNDAGYDFALDASDNIIVTGKTVGPDTSSDIFIIKLNNSGDIQWQKSFTGISSNDIGRGISTDSLGNIYVGSENGIIKLNSSGVLQWQKVIDTGMIDSIAVDSQNNVFISSYPFIVMKLNSSGDIQWQKTITDAGEAISISVDSNDDVFVSGFTGFTNTNNNSRDLYVCKFNNSGTIQWQISIGSSFDEYQWYFYGHRALSVNDNSLVITGYTYSTNPSAANAITVQLPKDGSLTGTYGDFIYQSQSYEVTDSSVTLTTSSLTENVTTLTTSSASLTVSDNSLNGYSANTIQIGS